MRLKLKPIQFSILIATVCLIAVIITLYVLFTQSNIQSTVTQTEDDSTSTEPLVPTVQENDQADATTDTSRIVIISTKPEDGSEGYPVEGEVIVQFNKEVSQSDITIQVFPDIPIGFYVLENTLTLQFFEEMSRSTRYSVQILHNTDGHLGGMVFTTTGPTPTPVEYLSSEIIARETEQTQIERPDVYLYQFVPYQGDSFSIEAIMVESTGESYFEYTITKTGSEVIFENEFNEWILSTGLTEQQKERIILNII